jgi:membrane glycosyltransferase
MIVLDADSIMSGQALVSLAQLMDAHPDVGIIQTLPLLAGRETLFARLLQFAVRLNGSMLASGLAFWQLSESNYWGHNAILRLRRSRNTAPCRDCRERRPSAARY